MIKNFSLISFYLVVSVFINIAKAQYKPLKVTSYGQQDIGKFEKEFDFEYNSEEEKYGKTDLIIHTTTNSGSYFFVLKKKIKKTEKSGGIYRDIYGLKRDGNFDIVRKDYVEPDTISEHDLYAFIYIEDHGGLLKKVKFQDFGSPVYFPEFDLKNCMVADEDKDGRPEFYLSYIGFSDGLDPKPYKQIVYTIPKESKNKSYTKAKTTRFFNMDEEQGYRDEFDENWHRLPDSVKNKSRNIIFNYKYPY